MPYVLKDKPVPASLVKNQDKISCVVQTLNGVVPFMEAAAGTAQTLIFFGESGHRVKALKWILDINTYLIGLL